MAAETTYRRFKVDGKVVHCGITTDLVRREREHSRRWPNGRIEQVGPATTREEAWHWERQQASSGSRRPTEPPAERSLDERGHIDIEPLTRRCPDALRRRECRANEYRFLLSDHVREATGTRRAEAVCDLLRSQGMLLRHVQLRRFHRRGAGGDRWWNPYWGYGFFCPSSLDTIATGEEFIRGTGVAAETPRIGQTGHSSHRQHHTPSRWSSGPRSAVTWSPNP